jgi:hypothetical protein
MRHATHNSGFKATLRGFMSVQSYIVYEDSQGKLGAVLDPHDPDFKIELWMEGKKIKGYVTAHKEIDAIIYMEDILPEYRGVS